MSYLTPYLWWLKTKKKPRTTTTTKSLELQKNYQTECAQFLPTFAILKKDLHVCSNDAEGQI